MKSIFCLPASLFALAIGIGLSAPVRAGEIPCPPNNPGLARLNQLQQLGVNVTGNGNTFQVWQGQAGGNNHGVNELNQWQNKPYVPIVRTNPTASLHLNNSLNPWANATSNSYSGAYTTVVPTTTSSAASNPVVIVGPNSAQVINSGNSSSSSYIRH